MPLPDALGLGSPGELLRQTAIDDASQVRYGSEYDPALPTARVTGIPESPGVLFMNPAAGPPLQPAWAVFSFDLTGYDEEPLLKLTWNQKPLGGTAWLVLSNWAQNRWEFVATDPATVTLESLAPYISETGKLLAGVIVGGSVQRQLRWIAVGDAPAPAPPMVFNVFPTSSNPDSELTLTAQVTGTTPLSYIWEFFGGGADPAVSMDEKPTVTLGALGDYDARVVVSNKYGSIEHNFQIHSVHPTWTARLIGDGGKNKFVALETTATDNSIVAAEMDDQRISLFEFDKDGELLWNRAYTGLPANRVTEIALTSRDHPAPAETYVACYQDDGPGPGNAYLVKVAVGGDVLWYQPLGPGIPDVSVNDEGKVAVSVARPDGISVVAWLDSDGTIEWSKRTAEETNFFCSAAGASFLNEGVYLGGEVDGQMAIMRVNPNGSLGWAAHYSGLGKIKDIAHVDSTGLAVVGTLPLPPTQQRESFFLNVRVDGRLLNWVKYNTHPYVPTKLSTVRGFVFMTCNTLALDEASVYVLDAFGGFYRALRFEGLGGIIAGDTQFSRYVHEAEPPPPPPPPYFMLAGSGLSKDLTISRFEAAPQSWLTLYTNFSIGLTDFSLPSESLEITPEEVAYTLDTPAGNLDGIFLSGTNLF